MNDFNIDKKDRKIINELNKNSRASYSDISKAVGLPKNVVAYRIKNLVDSGLINLFCTIINKELFDYFYARLFLKFYNYDANIEKKLLDFLEKHEGSHWVASLNGCYDFCVIFLCKDIEKLMKAYTQLVYEFNQHIFDKEFSIAVKQKYYPFQYVFEDEENKIKQEAKKIELDKEDFEIINLMKQNSRISLLEISNKTALTPKTVREKIKRMMKNRIIQSFRIRLDHSKLGFHHFHTFLSFINVSEKKENEIIEFLSTFKSTIHVIKGTGKWDLEFQSVIRSHFQLYDIVNALRQRFPENIKNTESALIYKIHSINTVKYY